jgi:small subunit ribosomal protein S16
MAVRIRLSRVGKKSVPFFRVVAVDSREKRDGAFLENLGTYDAHKSKLLIFKEDRVADWVSKGAIPTDTVKKLWKQYKRAEKAV